MRKNNYLILAEVMLKLDDMNTLAELVKFSGFNFAQVDDQIAVLKYRNEYSLLIDRSGCKQKYGLKIANTERTRDFVTELFTGRVENAIELSKHVLKCESA